MGISRLVVPAAFAAVCLSVGIGTSLGQVRTGEHAESPTQTARTPLRTTRLIVKVRTVEEFESLGWEHDEARARECAARARLVPLRLRTTQGPALTVLECGSVTEAARVQDSLEDTGDYTLIEPDWLVFPASSEPNDPFYRQQWHLERIAAPTTWEFTVGARTVTMAMVDTGIDRSHPDLIATLVPGYNAVDHLTTAQGGQTDDVNGHGTETAGVAAATGDNAAGICGIAWNLRLMPVRATNSPGGAAYMSEIIDGIGWAIGTGGARVVTTGYAGVRAQVVESVGLWARQMNAILVWPAENSGDAYDDFDWRDVIIVGGTDRADARASFSCHGRAIDLSTPATNIYTTQRGGLYGWTAGNSYTAPQVAATLALMLSVAPEISPSQAETALKLGCSPLSGPDAPRLGAGLLNVAESVRLGSRVDFNRDGFIDLFDYVGFVAAFESGNRHADINNDGFVDFFDYDWFIRLFQSTW